MLTDYTAAVVVTEDGTVKLVTPIAYKNAMKQFQRGPAVMRIEIPKKGRSSQANRYYWGVVLALIADHTGYEQDELHEYFKTRFNPINFVFAGDEQVIGGSTRQMTSKQFAEYIDRIRRFAETELGMTLPEPERAIA